MSRGQIWRTLAVLTALAAIGVGGWFLGVETLAGEGGAATTLQVRPQASAGDGTALLPVTPLSGVGLFGHADGLSGRVALVGRIAGVDGDLVTLTTALGEAQLALDESTFLLRLGAGDAATLSPGAALAALLTEADGATLRSALVLPESSRPQRRVNPPEGDGANR